MPVSSIQQLRSDSEYRIIYRTPDGGANTYQGTIDDVSPPHFTFYRNSAPNTPLDGHWSDYTIETDDGRTQTIVRIERVPSY